MKKTVRVLSAVLILTALIGLLGGGLTLKDVGSAKAFWEDKRTEALEGIDTLENGLNPQDAVNIQMAKAAYVASMKVAEKSTFELMI